MEELIFRMLKASILLMIPATGELFNQRAGSLNIGVEGMMLIGVLSTIVVGEITGNIWLAVLGGMAAGGILGLLNGFMAVSLRVDQVASGLGIWIFALGGTTYFGAEYWGTSPVRLPTFTIGSVSFTPMMLIAPLIVFISWWILERTQFGLKVKSTGEDPRIAEVWGTDVFRIRYLGMIVSGVTAGLGGAYLITHYTTVWAPELTAGRGWIALALVFFSLHKAKYIGLSSLFFGGIWILALQIPGWIGGNIQLIRAIPYTATVVVLFAFRYFYKTTEEPESLGLPYFRE